MSSKNFIFCIGINEYQSHLWSNLNNAVLDAQELKNILIEKYSFEEHPVNLYNANASKAEIYSSLSILNQSVTENDNVIIFFAGHGIMDPHTRRGFWIPNEGTYDRTTWIENSVIKDFINDCPAKNILLIIDSCFSGTFLTKNRSVSLGKTYEELASKRSRWVISSGSEEKVSDGILTEHSPFCKLIIRYLNENKNKNTSVSELFNFINVLISKEATQRPLCSIISNVNHEDGEFIFTIGNGASTSDIKTTIGVPNSENLKIEYLTTLESENRLAAGKEILIIKSYVEEYDYLILEIFRFNDKNEKKITFSDNLAINDINDSTKNWELVQRFATWQGLEKYLATHEEITNKKSLIIGAHKDIDKVEDEPISIYYSQYLSQLFDLNTNKMHCLHCGEKISNNDSYLIEFDELGYNVNVGNVHKKCLRPSDRILGKCAYDSLEDDFLINFDFDLWISLYESGQGQIKGVLANYDKGKNYVIVWNSENNSNDGQYCIRVKFDNGDDKFMMVGNQVQRFTESEIDEWVNKFNKGIRELRPGKIIETGINGYYDSLIQIKEPQHNISLVVSYTKVRYSKLYEIHENIVPNNYTPLCCFQEEKSYEIFKIGNVIPLLSNPENFKAFSENWETITGKKIKMKTKILGSDIELGGLITQYEAQSVVLVVNPIFDLTTHQLSTGLVFRTFESLKQSQIEITSEDQNSE